MYRAIISMNPKVKFPAGADTGPRHEGNETERTVRMDSHAAVAQLLVEVRGCGGRGGHGRLGSRWRQRLLDPGSFGALGLKTEKCVHVISAARCKYPQKTKSAHTQIHEEKEPKAPTPTVNNNRS